MEALNFSFYWQVHVAGNKNSLHKTVFTEFLANSFAQFEERRTTSRNVD